MSSRQIGLFQPGSLISDLEKYEKCEASIEKAQALLPAARFQFQGRLKECLKDRKEGGRILKEVSRPTVPKGVYFHS